MKRIAWRNFFLIFILVLNCSIGFSQEQKEIIEMSQENIDFFEDKLIFLKKHKHFNIKKESRYSNDYIDTIEELILFLEAMLIIQNARLKIPNAAPVDLNNTIYEIGEDKTKKMWFVKFRFKNSYYPIKLIIVKNNCKIAYTELTR
jgi:hypothetical protein